MKQFNRKFKVFSLLFLLFLVVLLKTSTYASTELQAENLPETGSTNSTFYNFVSKGSASDPTSLNFNIKNLSSFSYNDPRNTSLTFENKGFKFFQLVSNSAITNSTDPGTGLNFNTNSNSVNGAVAENDGIETKITVYPAEDNQYIIVNLEFANTSATDKYMNFRLSGEITTHDKIPDAIIDKDAGSIYINNNSFTNSYDHEPEAIETHYLMSFDGAYFISNDSSLGLTPFTVVYLNTYGDSSDGYWADWVDNLVPDDTYFGGAMNIGWKNIHLRKHEKTYRRFAVKGLTPSVYVNELTGADTYDITNIKAGDYDIGTFSKPFKTISRAINFLNNEVFDGRGVSKANIFLQSDINLNTTIDLQDSSSLKEVTIGSADLTTSGTANNNTYTLFDNGYDIKLSTSELFFDNINIKGTDGINRDRAFIQQKAGKTIFGKGVKVQNLKNLSGPALLDSSELNNKIELYGVDISNCISGGNYPGVILHDCSSLQISGKNNISGNKTSDGKLANLFLRTGKYIEVSNKIDDSTISVSTEDKPDVYGEVIDNLNQERIIAKPISSYPLFSGLTTCPFKTCFSSDDPSETFTEGRNASNTTYTVLTKKGVKISFDFIDIYNTPVTDFSRDPIFAKSGEALTIAPPFIESNGYYMSKLTIEGDSADVHYNGDDSSAADYMYVYLTTKTNNIKITYILYPQRTKISFVTNGGEPKTVNDITGNINRPVNGYLPVLNKYGYILQGWFDNNTNSIGHTDFTTGKIESLPAVFPNTDQTIYYAKFAPDPNVTLPISELHSNEDGTIIFYNTPTANIVKKHIEEDLSSLNYKSKNIPGYNISKALSSITPAKYLYRNEELDVGTLTLNGSVLSFTGLMPAMTTLVSFKYTVNQSVKKNLKVEFYKENSNDELVPLEINGNTSIIIGSYYAEQNITYTPPSKDGYALRKAYFKSGNVADIENFYTAATGSFNSSNAYIFSGKMPNQDVVLAYVYKSNGSSNEYIISYLDDNTLDPTYANASSFIADEKSFEDQLTAESIDIYGYKLISSEVNPSTAGSFSTDHKFTGTMPLSSAVNVKYHYNRDPNYFKQITYKPSAVCANSLSIAGKSPDLSKSDNNVTTSVLITSASGNGWSFETLSNRLLVPDVIIDNPALYEFNGFFIDTNSNQRFDDGEVIVDNNTVFTGSVDIVPNIKELYYNITITFSTDGNGSLSFSGDVNTYTNINKWSDVTKPATSGYYTTFQGWYLNGNLVQDNDLLVDGGVYVAVFSKDLSMTNKLKKVLYISEIDENGNGKIIVRDVHANYLYIVSDINDNIIKIKSNLTAENIVFDNSDGIDINTTYNLYEVKDMTLTDAEALTTVNSISPDKKSEKNICYVPAVINNYNSSVDTNQLNSENKKVAKLTIKPSSINYEYAIYDNGSIVDGTSWTTGSVSGIVFDNLIPGKSYRIVTKKSGNVSDTTGTVVYIDSLEKLTKDTHALIVINGTSNGEVYKLVKAGDKVDVSTLSDDFVRWTSMVGNVSFNNSMSKETFFTMPSKNVIIMAKELSSSANLRLNSKVYGDNDYGVYINDSKELALIDTLAGDVEKYLSNNGFKLSYKVSLTKDILTFDEQTLLENERGVAARGAFAIDLCVDRYLDGYRVDVFDEVLPIPTYGTEAIDHLSSMFGDNLFEKVDGLEEYILKEEASQVEEEVSQDEKAILKNSDNTDIISSDDADETVESTITESDTNDSNVSDDFIDYNDSEDSSVSTDANNEISNDTITDNKDEEISGFTIGTEEKNNEYYETLLDNLMLYGSSFNNAVSIDVYIQLLNSDMGNDNYKVYESSAGGLSEVALLTNANLASKGLIGFTASTDKRYIITYDKYNTVTILNKNSGAYEKTGIEEYKEYKIKYGELLDTSLQTLADYEYNKVQYKNGVWSYKENNRSAQNIFDATIDTILTPITIYAVYENNKSYIDDLLKRIHDVLFRAESILNNYFLLAKERQKIKPSYDALYNLIQSDNFDFGEAENLLNDLAIMVEEIEPKLAIREVDYQNQKDQNVQPKANTFIGTKTASRVTSSVSGSSGGSGGSGGGGGGSISGVSLGGQNAVTNLSPIDATFNNNILNQNLTNLNMTNLNTFTAQGGIVSTKGYKKSDFGTSGSIFTRQDGSLVSNEWVLTNNGWYHPNSSGVVDTGWKLINSNWYYFDESNSVNNGRMHTGWLSNNYNGSKNTYYLSSNGDMLTGYQLIDGKTYYFSENSNGNQLKGALLINGVTPNGSITNANGMIIN